MRLLGNFFIFVSCLIFLSACGRSSLPGGARSTFFGSEVENPYAPQITLVGGETMRVEVFARFEEPGYTAQSLLEGNISWAVEVSGEVDTTKLGNYLLRYMVKDSEARIAEKTRNVTVADLTAPRVTMLGSTTMDWVPGSPFVDPGATVQDNYDSNLSVIVSGSVDVLRVGEYALTYKAVDSSGNQSLELTRLVRVVDSTPPVLTVTTPTDGLLIRAPFSVQGQCESNLQVELSGDIQNGSRQVTCASGAYSFSNVSLQGPDGSKSITIFTTDLGQNDVTITRSLTLDTSAPVLSIATPVENALFNTKVIPFTGSCEVGRPIQLTGNGSVTAGSATCAAGGTYSFTFTFGGNDGTKTLTLSQQDAAGNSTSITRKIEVDTQAPTLTISSPTEGSSFTTKVIPFTGSCEAGRPIQLTGSGSVTAGSATCAAGGIYSFTFTFSGNDGTKTLTLSQQDAAGNSTSVTRKIEVDTSLPTLTIQNPIENALLKVRAVSFNGICEAGRTIQISGASGSVTSGSATCAPGNSYAFTYTFSSDGLKVLTLTIADAAGNTSSATRRVEIDSVSPVISLNGANPLDLTVCQNFSEPGATASDVRDGNLTAQLVVTSNNVKQYEAGLYTVTYRVSDQAGNVATLDRSVRIYGKNGETSNFYGLFDLASTSPLLTNFSTSAKYMLCQDIILGNVSPIGTNAQRFQGALYGAGKKIKSGKISSNSDFVGFFAVLDQASVIEDLIFEDIQVEATGSSFVGTIAGSSYGKVTEVAVVGNGYVRGANKVGGLVGHNDDHLTRSFATVNVRGVSEVGGLVGHNEGKVIESFSHAQLELDSTATWAYRFGGLIGLNDDSEGVDVHHCYALGTGLSSLPGFVIGGLIGEGKAEVVTNSYWNSTVSGIPAQGGGTFRRKYGRALSDSQMRDKANFTNNFQDWGALGAVTTSWNYDDALSPYPLLKWVVE